MIFHSYKRPTEGTPLDPKWMMPGTVVGAKDGKLWVWFMDGTMLPIYVDESGSEQQFAEPGDLELP